MPPSSNSFPDYPLKTCPERPDHNPPNAKAEYDRADTSPWPSDCLSWAPTATPGPTTQISCGVTWDAPSCADNGDSSNPALDYDIWWEQNFPGRGNTITYNGLPFRNWWDIHGEWDTIEGGTPSLTLPPAALSCHVERTFIPRASSIPAIDRDPEADTGTAHPKIV